MEPTPDGIFEAMLARARLAWKCGDHAFVVRQVELHRLCYESCDCESHSCGGCMVTQRHAAKLEVLELKLTDRERAIAENQARAEWRKGENEVSSSRGFVRANYDYMQTDEYKNRTKRATE